MTGTVYKEMADVIVTLFGLPLCILSTQLAKCVCSKKTINFISDQRALTCREGS